MSILGLYAGGIIGARGVTVVRRRDGESDLPCLAMFSALNTNAKLLSAGSFPWITQNNCLRAFFALDYDVRPGDIIAPADRAYILYSDLSYAPGGVNAYRAMFALRLNADGLVFERYRDEAGPAGGITAALKHVPYATGIAGHFWKANEFTAATNDGRFEKSDAFLVTRLRTDIAPGDMVEIDNRQYSFDGFDVRAHEGILVIKLARVQ